MHSVLTMLLLSRLFIPALTLVNEICTLTNSQQLDMKTVCKNYENTKDACNNWLGLALVKTSQQIFQKKNIREERAMPFFFSLKKLLFGLLRFNGFFRYYISSGLEPCILFIFM